MNINIFEILFLLILTKKLIIKEVFISFVQNMNLERELFTMLFSQ